MIQALELSCYLKPERVLDLVPSDKDDLFELLATMIVQDPAVHDPVAVRKALFDRERKANTGIGHGFAVPHARCECVDDFVVAFARIKDGMDYGSDDGIPVKIVFMIVASEVQDKQYIKLLSRLMLRLRNPDFIEDLLSAKDPSELFNLLRSSR